MLFDYLLGLDFGSITDHTALILVARRENPEATSSGDEGEPQHIYELIHTEQLPLGLSYVEIVEYIAKFVQQEEIAGMVQIAADCTGVGKAVLDLMRSEPSLAEITWSIVFTSGQNVTQNGMIFKVPKKDLIASVLILTGKDLLHCNPEIDQAQILKREMLSYIVRRTASANNKFDGEHKSHDDMVVALCMVCWIGERIPIDLTMSHKGSMGATSPGKTTSGNPLITAETGGVNLGFGRPPRESPQNQH